VTTVTAWVSYDQRAPSGAYVASDSLISTPTSDWSNARKTFHSLHHPEVFAYVGDVLFPSLLLGQHVAHLDSGVDPLLEVSADKRRAALIEAVTRATETYPSEWMAGGTTTIVHIARQGTGLGVVFVTTLIRIIGRQVSHQVIDSLDSAGVLEFTADGVHDVNRPILEGSGANAVETELGTWQPADRQYLSRRVFEAHCRAIESGKARASGGAPQLVGLYRKGPGRAFGFAAPGHRASLFGSPIRDDDTLESLEFRNRLFECVDREGRLLPGAKSHEDEATE
jgi:hypothetical protein